MLRNNLGLMDVTPSLLLQADNRGHCRDKRVPYQLPLQSLCLEPKQEPSHWMLCLGWVLEEIFFFFLKINSTVLGAQQHRLSDRIMKLVEQHFPPLEMKSHSFHGNTLPLLLDPSKGGAQRESFCVARGTYPKQPSWWGFEPKVLCGISPMLKRFRVAVIMRRGRKRLPGLGMKLSNKVCNANMKTRIWILGARVKAGRAWQPPRIPELWGKKRHRVGVLASWTSQNCQTVVLLRDPTSVTKAKSGWGEYLLISTLISTCTRTDVYMRLYTNVWAHACKHVYT